MSPEEELRELRGKLDDERQKVILLQQFRGADTGLKCAVCGGRIFGTSYGHGDGAGKKFAHGECHWRDRALRAERLLEEKTVEEGCVIDKTE